MKKIRHSNQLFFAFHSLLSYSNQISHFLTNRNFGSTNPPYENLKLHFNLQTIIFSDQPHSDQILILTDSTQIKNKSEFQGYDAIITNIKKLPILIKVADCQAIIIFDPIKNILALIHAGWRGQAKNLLPKVLNTLKHTFHSIPNNLYACIGPSLGPCHSEFTEPLINLPAFFIPFIFKKNYINLQELTKSQLLSFGIQQSKIEFSNICTVCDSRGLNPNFFSYRATKTSNRFSLISWLN